MRKLVVSLVVIALMGCVSTPPTKSPQKISAKKLEAIANYHASVSWLRNNLKNRGVESKNGLQYKKLEITNGCKIDPRRLVVIHHEWLDHKSDDISVNSFKYNKPLRVPVDGFFEGLKIGIPMMRKGEIWEFYIPPNLAYGHIGSKKANVGPYMIVRVKIQLVDGQCLN